MGDLTGPGLSGGESGEPWGEYDPGDIGRCWSVPKTCKYARYLNDILLPGYLSIEGVHARLEKLDKAGMIHDSSKGWNACAQALPATGRWTTSRGHMDRHQRDQFAGEGASQLPDAGTDWPCWSASSRPAPMRGTSPPCPSGREHDPTTLEPLYIICTNRCFCSLSLSFWVSMT